MLRLRPAIRAFATKKLNLNADLGEGFGPWRLTDDAALMELVTCLLYTSPSPRD